jgi:hypothetical protein
VIEAVADGLGDPGPARDAGALCFEEGPEGLHQRRGLRLPHGLPLRRALASDGGLDLVRAPMRASASMAIGALPPLAMSKNWQCRWAQHKASVMRSAASFL